MAGFRLFWNLGWLVFWLLFYAYAFRDSGENFWPAVLTLSIVSWLVGWFFFFVVFGILLAAAAQWKSG